MAGKEEITITIGPDGTINMEYKGVTGKKCVDATQELEVALGKVEERQHTPDYYKPDPEREVFEKW